MRTNFGMGGLVWWIVSILSYLKFLRSEQIHQTPVLGARGNSASCYDKFRNPQRCIPEFENAAFNVLMEATNTCGDNGRIEFCRQTLNSDMKKSCEICYPNQHPANYLTDFHNVEEPTWWQSETMMEGIQHPNQVNLTLHLGKAFDITYVRLWFSSPRPESFAIFKRSSENGPWVPYQYYSASCRDTYGQPDSTRTIRGEETRALCKSEYSDISPLTDGNVAFSTLEGRPSAYNFDDSPALQEWVTATDIRITLDRLNTFGEEVFGAEQVLRSYFYAIADVAVGARCKCNGHASECIESTSVDGSRKRVCKCEHNTGGPDCNECQPFFKDVPWRRATAKNGYECKICNCNGFSNRCYFDNDLYNQTGHGGHCLDCVENRDGPNCEHCKENFYMQDNGRCIPCNCNPTGSRSLQCNSEGKCQCKPGVTGDTCDRCEVNHYDFGSHGCKNCGCSEIGSLDNQPQCDPYTGACRCKENVEGQRCKECKPGFFHLDKDNEFGCTPCFCFGHSSQCMSATGYYKYQLATEFSKSPEKWTAIEVYARPLNLEYNVISHSISVTSVRDEKLYFVASDRYLKDQRPSYNQILQFTLRVKNSQAMPSAEDVILEGAGRRISIAIFQQNQNRPTTEDQIYKFRLHEDAKYGWEPRLSARDFMSVLSNLTAIKIRATYSSQDIGFLNDFKLETAHRGIAGQPALWVEQCSCPDGYVGQFCESCSPGFRHSLALGGGPFMDCTPCDCNKHADICESETGRCICQHNTAGDNCELCARGFYGNALGGTPNDCEPCGCPNGGACAQTDDDTIFCIECPEGYTGRRCDSCSEGYFGDPNGNFGPRSECKLCDCNSNIDPNAIGNCNTTTGECLKCIHNTGGPKCDQCLEGYFGNALALPKGDCTQCQCNIFGAEWSSLGSPICDQVSGACQCKAHVVGRNCDRCENGFFKLESNEGCEACHCDPIGSINSTCDISTGQCFCRPGITGLHCDHCEPRKYGFSMDGCKPCECDEIGSKTLQCDPSGQCPCLDNVEGRRCDRCKENKYDRQRGCIDCPDCYNLVQNAAREHNEKLDRLEHDLDEIEMRPTVNNDDFTNELKSLRKIINDYHNEVTKKTGINNILQQVQDLKQREKGITRTLSEIDENIAFATDKVALAVRNITSTEGDLNSVRSQLENITFLVDTTGKSALQDAFDKAKKVGKQSDKMTQIAKEAMDIANDLDSKANELTEKAQEAKNKSGEAYKLAENAIKNQNEIVKDKINDLLEEINKIEKNLNSTNDFAATVHAKTAEVKEEALRLLNQATNFIVPQDNIEAQKEESAKIKEEADRLQQELAALTNKHEELRMNIDDLLFSGNDTLQRAHDQQMDLGQQLADIQLYEKQINMAVETGDKLLENTRDTYRTLRDFDKEVQENKQAAKEAIEKIPSIEKIIQTVSTKYAEGHNTIIEAKEYADSALKKALEADELGQNASKNAEEIKKDAELLYKNTTELQSEAENMAGRILNTEAEFKLLADKNRNNESLIAIAKEKVSLAGKETDEAILKVDELLSNVRSIISELDNLPQIDEKKLDELDRQLRKAEQQVQKLNLEAQLEELQKKQREQDILFANYNDEISRLEKEVNNIEQIANALPAECFKKVELEP